MLTERHFKNEDVIKDMIVEGHRNGVCDSNGASVKRNGVFTAKSRILSSSARTFICRNGKMVLKHG